MKKTTICCLKEKGSPQGRARGRTLAFMLVSLFVVQLCPKFSSTAQAQDDPYTRRTLHGLPGVHVYVEELSPEVEKKGLTRTDLQKEIEELISNAGIHTMTREEMFRSSGKPYLYVQLHITVLRTEITRYLFTIRIELNQEVSLTRQPYILLPAATWSTGGSGIDFDLKNIRAIVREKVKDFIRAYLSVNPELQRPEAPPKPQSDS